MDLIFFSIVGIYPQNYNRNYNDICTEAGNSANNAYYDIFCFYTIALAAADVAYINYYLLK